MSHFKEANLSECRFWWDEPPECTTPRGWLHLANHPDENECSTCVGNYLTYNEAEGKNGEKIHAMAYVIRTAIRSGLHHTIYLGNQWFFTIDEAKEWIESRAADYFDLGREESIHVESFAT